MKAIILAAGRGSRMGGGTAELPKGMMRLWGRPLLEMCVETLERAGFARRDIGVVTGYRSDRISLEGVRFFHNENWEHTNMFVSLTKAREWLYAEPCIVCYSDIVFHENAVKRLMECGREFAITYYTGFLDLWRKRFSNPLEDMETFRLNPNGTLAEIGLRPKSEDEVQGQYMGLLRFEPSGWEKIEQAIRLPMKKSVEKLDMTTLLNHLISLGYPVYAIASEERWLECDNQEDIRLYERLYPNGGKKHG